ncbi:MAG: RsmE family RNA methyltransferase [Chloroflexota bacterium]
MAGRRHPGVTHRFFLPPGSLANDVVTFPDSVAHQIQRVLRLGPGDRVVALDGSGSEAVVRLLAGPDAAGVVEERRANLAEPTIELALFLGLTKASKLELVVQKGTEIGVSRFVPMLTERSVRTDLSDAKIRRLDTIAIEAAEQSERGKVPVVEPLTDFNGAVSMAREHQAVMLWEEEQAIQLGQVPLAAAGPVGLLVGPEGGFTADEAEMGVRAGLSIASLGKRILRAETAAIVAAALVLARLGDLG